MKRNVKFAKILGQEKLEEKHLKKGKFDFRRIKPQLFILTYRDTLSKFLS